MIVGDGLGEHNALRMPSANVVNGPEQLPPENSLVCLRVIVEVPGIKSCYLVAVVPQRVP